MSETRERVHIEDGTGGELIADSQRLKLVCEVPYYPAYYFPRGDVRMELLTPNGTPSARRAEATRLQGLPNTGPWMPAARR